VKSNVSEEVLNQWAKSIATAIQNSKMIEGDEMMVIFVNIIKAKTEAKNSIIEV